jgi:hypothetical protein
MATVQGLTVTIGADTKQFAAAMKQIDAEARAISKDLKTVNDNLKLDPSNSKKAAESLKLLQEQAQKASDKVKLIKDAIDKLNKGYAAGNISADDYAKSMSHLNTLLSQAQHEQDLANEKVKQFGDEAEEAGKDALSLGDIIKGNLISNAILNGLSKLKDLAMTIAKYLLEAAKAVAKFSWEAVKSAAEYEDALGYAQTVYGEMSEQSIQWAKDNSENLRISTKQLTQYMNTLGQVFHTQGLSAEEALDMTKTLMEMAADIRAATGMTTDEILPVMQRGFTTSVKNFRQFGVIMTDAEVKAYALAHGLAQVTVDETKLAEATANLHDKQNKAQEALTKYGEGSVELEKAEAALMKAEEKYNEVLEGEVDNFESASIIKARYLLLSERLANIHGQNTKEAELFNSQLALLKTKFENLRDEIGMELLPVFTELVTKFNEFLSSEEGQALLQKVVEQFKTWAKTISEMMDDGRFTEYINNLVEKLPQIIELAGQIGTWVIENTPLIAEMIDKVLQLFGIKTENQQIKEAFIEVEDQIKQTAKQSGIDINTMIDAIHAYAEANDTDLLDIYNDWGHYGPEIGKYITQVGTDAQASGSTLEAALSGMTSSTANHVEQQISMWDRLSSTVSNIWAGITSIFSEDAWNQNKSFLDGWDFGSNFGNFGAPHAGGGPVEAGRMYRVNDDAGHRSEWYIPNQDGYILNGNQTDRIVNNNNSRSVGDVNIYVQSYGMNVAEVADELGAAMNRKLRMSGAII